MAGNTDYSLPAPELDGEPNVLIVVAPYYKDIADQLLEGAQAAITSAGGTFEMVEVPGALEVPGAIRLARRHADFDAFVGLGCVIRGETSHYEIVAGDSARGLSQLALEGVPVGNGILTVETHEQAAVRADPQGQNKGGGAAEAALHLLALSQKWQDDKPSVGFLPMGNRAGD
ncbi:MAG: 6,7-dimethyl-8-ribityllumazine synthase [Pseudomonadota bacterium]